MIFISGSHVYSIKKIKKIYVIYNLNSAVGGRLLAACFSLDESGESLGREEIGTRQGRDRVCTHD